METIGEVMCLTGMATSAVFIWNYMKGRHRYKMRVPLFWFSAVMLCIGHALLVLAEK